MKVVSCFTFAHPGEGVTKVTLKANDAGYWVEVDGAIVDDRKFVVDLDHARAAYSDYITKLLYTGD